MDTPITISDRNKLASQSHHLTIGALILPRLEFREMIRNQPSGISL